MSGTNDSDRDAEAADSTGITTAADRRLAFGCLFFLDRDSCIDGARMENEHRCRQYRLYTHRFRAGDQYSKAERVERTRGDGDAHNIINIYIYTDANACIR